MEIDILLHFGRNTKSVTANQLMLHGFGRIPTVRSPSKRRVPRNASQALSGRRQGLSSAHDAVRVFARFIFFRSRSLVLRNRDACWIWIRVTPCEIVRTSRISDRDRIWRQRDNTLTVVTHGVVHGTWGHAFCPAQVHAHVFRTVRGVCGRSGTSTRRICRCLRASSCGIAMTQHGMALSA